MKKFRKGVFCVVYFGKRYLLLHRKLHWKGWEFPKGGLLAREKEIHAVVREIKEETGLKIISIKKLGLKNKFIYDKKTQQERKAKGFDYVLFACEVSRRKVRISKREHDGFRWLQYSKALRLLTWANQKKSLKIVHKSLSKI